MGEHRQRNSEVVTEERKLTSPHNPQHCQEQHTMTHAVRIRILTFCLAVLPGRNCFQPVASFPPRRLSQTPTFSTHSFLLLPATFVTLHGDFNNDGYEDLIIAPVRRHPRLFVQWQWHLPRTLTYTLPKGSAYLFGCGWGLQWGRQTRLGRGDFLWGGGNFGVSTYLGNGDGPSALPSIRP